MSGIVCVLMGGPEYEIEVSGRVYRFEDHPYCGPTVVGKRGNPLSVQPLPFLEAATLWAKQGRRVEGGRAVWEKEREPQLIELVRNFWVEVPEGRTPEEVRAQWLNKVRRPTDTPTNEKTRGDYE